MADAPQKTDNALVRQARRLAADYRGSPLKAHREVSDVLSKLAAENERLQDGDYDEPPTRAEWERMAANTVQLNEMCRDLTNEVARLQASLESVGEHSSTCVGKDLGRRCRYCQCEGRNLT